MAGEFTVIVQVIHDKEAGVYSASSRNVPGVAIESESLDVLRQRLLDVIPEMIVENRHLFHAERGEEVPLELLIQSQESIAMPA